MGVLSKVDVKIIFNNIYLLYKRYNKYDLFKLIIRFIDTCEDEELALNAFMNITELYKKYSEVGTEKEWNELVIEARALCLKFDSKLCKSILCEILCIIEKTFLENEIRGGGQD